MAVMTIYGQGASKVRWPLNVLNKATPPAKRTGLAGWAGISLWDTRRVSVNGCVLYDFLAERVMC